MGSARLVGSALRPQVLFDSVADGGLCFHVASSHPPAAQRPCSFEGPAKLQESQGTTVASMPPSRSGLLDCREAFDDHFGQAACTR